MSAVRICDESHTGPVVAEYNVSTYSRDESTPVPYGMDLCRDHFAERMEYYRTGGLHTDEVVTITHTLKY